MKRVAVVGSGLAGLTVAHLLAQSDEFEVTIYEKQGCIGMSSQSVDVDFGSEEVHQVDAPMRIIIPDHYPVLLSLIDHFKVDLSLSKAYNNIFSFEKLPNINDIKVKKEIFNYLNVKNLSIWNVNSFKLKYLSYAIQCLKLILEGTKLKYLDQLGDIDESIFDFLIKRGYSTEFIRAFLVPIFSSILTCSYADIEAYPARIILDLFGFGLLYKKKYKVKDGVQVLCKKLLDHPRIRMVPVGVKSIQPVASKEGQTILITSDDGIEESYDDVVIATAPSQAYQLLKDHSTSFSSVFDAIKCVPVKVTTHSDTSCMPYLQSEWAPNILYVDQSYIKHGITKPSSPAHPDGEYDYSAGMAHTSINLSQPHIQGQIPVLQTTNPLIPIDKELIYKSGTLWRAYFDPKSEKNIDQLDKLQGQDNIWVVGSYTYPGVPLLEGCVANSMRVAKALGVSTPWLSESDPRHPVNYVSTPGSKSNTVLTKGFYSKSATELKKRSYLYQLLLISTITLAEGILGFEPFQPIVVLFFIVFNSLRLVSMIIISNILNLLQTKSNSTK